MTREIKNRVAVTQTKRTQEDPRREAKRLDGTKTLTPKKKGCC